MLHDYLLILEYAIAVILGMYVAAFAPLLIKDLIALKDDIKIWLNYLVCDLYYVFYLMVGR